MVTIRNCQLLKQLLQSTGVDQPWHLTDGQQYNGLFISNRGFNQLINEAYHQGYKISFNKSLDFDPREHSMCERPVVVEISKLPLQPKVGVLIKLANDSPRRDALIGFLVQAAERLANEIYETTESSHKVIYRTETILIQTTYNHQEIDYNKSLLATSPKDTEILLFSINQGCTPEQEAEANRLVKEEWMPTILDLAGVSLINTNIHVIRPKQANK